MARMYEEAVSSESHKCDDGQPNLIYHFVVSFSSPTQPNSILLRCHVIAFVNHAAIINRFNTSRMEFNEVLPGTHRLYDTNGTALQSDVGLKKHGDIVLVPQPTDSPNDPLHWSMPRKILHSSLVCLIVGISSATSNDCGESASCLFYCQTNVRPGSAQYNM